ncbi:response regulator transcription factor [Gimibacter soli]|uniref:Response regulator transcription factor n=1 Tax=Gimibacter soli TaxID=3024400 RepID=A0AAE9XLS4_9PROT|nr:response regulator transcription factor [Gimibacter soli]WCL53277.1 response regulator transcription factor [Gimibacter soli]
MEDVSVVHIIDDDRSLREALASLFASVGLETRLYAAVQDFLDADRPDMPACLVLDVRLPGMSGLDAQDHLKELGVHMPVVLMTGHGDIPMSVRGMKAGALDFLTKPFRDQDMLDAVLAALDHDRAQRSSDLKLNELTARLNTLSPRERQVMALVATGKLNKQIAWDLQLSEITVKIHRGAAMRKMEARTLPELVRMADALDLRVEATRN